MKTLLPVIAMVIFIVMVSIGERQVRSSPKWPPPDRHELGGWAIEDPAVLEWAAGLNLPATVPILWAWALSDAFAYAFDDHHLIVYLPWVIFVGCLWYFVGYGLDRFVARRSWATTLERNLVFLAQTFITLELTYFAIVSTVSPAKALGASAFTWWMWVGLTVIGWADLFFKGNRQKQRPR